jgi:Zn-dependent peptidase ImmA (M78 family)
MHQDGSRTGRKAEDEAQLFASAFLMPKADILAQIKRVSSIDHLIAAKKRWKVSLLALTVRLNRLEILSDWRYRDFCIQIRSRYKDSEPDGIPREHSVVWQKVMQSLWSEKVTQLDIARALDLPEREVSALIFGILHGSGMEPPPQRQPLALVAAR